MDEHRSIVRRMLPVRTRILVPLLTLLVALSLFGCAGVQHEPGTDTAAVKTAQKGWRRLDTAQAVARAKAMRAGHQEKFSWIAFRPAIDHSLSYVRAQNPDSVAVKLKGGHPATVTWARLERTLTRLKKLLPLLDVDPGLLGREFEWYEVLPDVFFTGYYLPAIHASMTPNDEYRYPLYGVPDDLESLDLGDFHPRWKGMRLMYRMENGKPVPYFDREDIDYGEALADRGLEIAWARDPVEVQNLQTQGSGILILPDGERVGIGYAGKNGRQFRGIGGIFKRNGYLAKGGPTYANMSRYVAEHPEQEREIMAQNPSYVFFRLLGPVDAGNGARGTIGYPVTDRITLAVDPKLVPLGAALAYDTSLPPTGPCADTAPSGLGLAQDTGGAIKGRHVDYFWGDGHDAEYAAWRTSVHGSLFLLLAPE